MTSPNPILARFASPNPAQDTRVAILSDLHLNLEQQGTWRVSHRTTDRLEATVASLNEQSLDAVLFIGDLVNDGRKRQFDAFDQVIEELRHPLYAIPGNHDLIEREDGSALELAEFERRYTPGAHPYHVSIGGLDVLALNSNRSEHGTIASAYEGKLAKDSIEWVSQKLETVDQPLVVVHHNLPGVRTLFEQSVEQLQITGGSPTFDNADALFESLAGSGGCLVLTGHLHFPAVVKSQGVTEFTLPSLGPYPCGYTILECDERGTRATFQSVATYEDRLEAFVLGTEQTRVQLAAIQLAGLPLRDEW